MEAFTCRKMVAIPGSESTRSTRDRCITATFRLTRSTETTCTFAEPAFTNRKTAAKTFTGDGGSDGIHVDHHALWMNNKDPRHMILGNDGGIHVTYDRMDHWDHLNHVAIGQFYHVGVDTQSGLQGLRWTAGQRKLGRSITRQQYGSGPVNTDWFRVGGGDGFVTLVDPEDPNQIYFESQNGGDGTDPSDQLVNAVSFVRDHRAVLVTASTGKRRSCCHRTIQRFTTAPAITCFGRYNRAMTSSAISPEITNSDKGAGSAITESPVEPGVIYVGTTDGAVWMTEDGGANWQPLFYQPEPK